MAHQLHLEKKKYREWMKAGLGLEYLRDGLAPFCDDIAKRQHEDILDNIKQAKKLSNATCDQCTLDNLKPDHDVTKKGNKQCKLGQQSCNCKNPYGKRQCPNYVCGAIYDNIIKNHGSSPPKPNWRNTDIQQWCTNPWSIAKCFISAPGYEQKTSAAETDCSGLLHLIINNKGFHDHIKCELNVLSKVIECRNKIFHSSSMELDEKTSNAYIKDIIAVLQDEKELCNRHEAQDAVKKLKELMKEDFIITTNTEVGFLHSSITAMNDSIHELENKLVKMDNVPTGDHFCDLETKVNKIKSHMDFEDTRATRLENVMASVDMRVASLEIDMASEDTRDTRLEKDMASVDMKVASLEEDMASGDTRATILEKDMASVDARVTRLEKGMTSVDTRVTSLEKGIALVKEDLKMLKSAQSSQQDQYHYIKTKLEFQKKLIKLYRGSILQVSAILLKPERNHCNFSEVYVRPRMTHETKNKTGQKEMTEIKSMADIFTKKGIALQSIYVLGNAGAGKTSFCRSLVNYWCLAHSEEQSVEGEFSGVNEMKKFDFLFYISLRHCKGVISIQGMLEKQYKSEVLTNLLDEESEKIIILLDGLDEWSPPKNVTSYQFQTKGLPERDNFKDYTIVSTSRPWKIETLGITDREVQQRLTLAGFGESSVKKVIYKSVTILNETFGKNKHPRDCEEKLRNKSLADIKHVPIILLQLICLWFDDKLKETSKCAIYTGMLELFFSWNDQKNTKFELSKKVQKMSDGIQLPQYLIGRNIFKLNRSLINEVARLAYETLFNKTNEASLTFDNSIFEQLEISDEIKTRCLRLGILTEDKCPSLTASTCQSTVLSFVHKSVQEYFAAVHIAIMFRTRVGSSADMENADTSDQSAQLFETCFSDCVTFETVFEQENVFIMLCGLEPRIATFISKYIYDFVNKEKHVLDYRRRIVKYDTYERIIYEIQDFIFNTIEEVRACQTGSQFNFYIGDIACSDLNNDSFCRILEEQYILPDSVRSFTMDVSDMDAEDAWGAYRTIKYMHKCQRLETFHIRGIMSSCKMQDSLTESICKVIDLNGSTLKTLSADFRFSDDTRRVCNALINHLPNIKHLVVLILYGVTVTHDCFTSLCTFLSGTSHLKEISINIDCECKCQHEADLSKHQQLQYLYYTDPITVTRANMSNLIVYGYSSHIYQDFMQVLDVFGTTRNFCYFCLEYDDTMLFLNEIGTVYTDITNRLMFLLSISPDLICFRLNSFVLTANVIKSPSEMENIELIELREVRMSLTTWQKFVDSLPVIPKAVKIEARDMFITRDGEECDLPNRIDGSETVAAFKYVKEREQLFTVNNEWLNTITFSTRK